jgi:hypothetical protein
MKFWEFGSNIAYQQVNLGSSNVGIVFMQCKFKGIMEVSWLPHMDQEEIM